ncbi:hypothetical protein [Rhizobium grahamii]|uniref:Fibronectin type-III domain-containing protein n=1 Tax=Rhizobium grahamii CCGE 502 TaxID=990285 RepID=S3I065_9HYPH|nr:hypothetical protein [Rhizobium grahamii]EPE98621.1 hypothetical protein RGCCGE502_09350 [Rhizobium grahamii CCGE 502]
MPQTLGLLPLIVSSLGTTVAAANALYLGTAALLYGGIFAGATFLSKALAPKPSVPKPEDGTYNLKQSVPSLPIILGRVKKAGDYAFLEEFGGVAYHITIHAGHRIQGYVQHYLHDEACVLDGAGNVISPDHFTVAGQPRVSIHTRTGAAIGVPYPDIVSVFPSIWGNDFRGDGLASIRMVCETVSSEDYLNAYPNQMPEHSAVIDGHAEIYDPRTGTSGFTTNLALLRLWHLTSPYGGKMSLSDMYMPDWINAANVCAQTVINRSGGSEFRYLGGFWFRADSDPIEVGRTMDQAADMVVYERPDGKIGVHAGEYVAPTITLTAAEIISFGLNANVDPSTTVLAVRGRYTDPTDLYNTNDAAIYGNPYIGEDTERTMTVENVAVQSHNHIQRLQKLAYIRRNGARVTITAHYDPDNDISYSRFVRIQYAPKLPVGIVEITSKVTISLSDMTVSFSGIVVPSGLYDFNAATEEGTPGNAVVILPPAGVPVPTGFSVVIQNEVVSGGSTAAYALATWTNVSDALTYELEWEKTSGSTGPQKAVSGVNVSQVRSAYLADGVQYKFRLRAWSSGASSDWTAYDTRTATADPTPPGVATGVSATGGVGQIAFNWTAPNSANYVAARIYTNSTNTMTGATLRATEYGPPSSADSRTITGLAAGTYFGFVEAINASGTPATAVATGSKTVT